MVESPLTSPCVHGTSLLQVLRAIRRRRGLRAQDVARAMGMRLRTYQRFESGKGGFSVARIHRFAAAADADPYAILMELDLNLPDFALHCLDNKAATLFRHALQRYLPGCGRDLARLDRQSLVAIYKRLFDDIAGRLAEQDAALEGWMTDPAPDPPTEDE